MTALFLVQLGQVTLTLLQEVSQLMVLSRTVPLLQQLLESNMHTLTGEQTLILQLAMAIFRVVVQHHITLVTPVTVQPVLCIHNTVP